VSGPRPLEDSIRVAIGDPNSVIGKRKNDEKGYLESMARWQTRAVMTVLRKRKLIEPEK
jgi:hypothetical protein